MNFQRTIGPTGLLLAGIGSVIGSGWLFGPLYTAQIAGPAAIISWIIGGILMIMIAFTFAELGSTFPVAGGMIQFAQYSHGPFISFLIGWMVWISSLAIAPVETLGLIQYISNYVPGLVTTEHVLTFLGIVAASFVMLIMCVLNYYGAQFFSRSNIFITSIKLIVPILTALLLISISFHPTNFVASNSGGFMPYGWHSVFAALPLGGVIYSLIGSNTILQLAGETKNPKRTIPLALIGSMLLCTLLYVLLQIAFIGAMSPSAIANGWSKIHYAGDNGPFAGIMAALGFSWFIIVIYADAIISPFGTGFIFTASTARVGYGLSQIGFMPAAFGKLSKKGVPFRYILINFCLGFLLFLPFPAWQKLAGFIISCFIFSYIIGPIALVALRKIKPDVPRPFLLPYANTMSLLAFYICNLLIFWTGWNTVSRMMLVLSIGFIFFLIYCFRYKKSFKKELVSALWAIPYCIALSVISYLSTFSGGKNIIPFGIDFIVIGLMSLIIFYLIIRLSKVQVLL